MIAGRDQDLICFETRFFSMKGHSSIAIVSLDDLELVVTKALDRSLRDILPTLLGARPQKLYLTKKEVSELTGWSIRQIDYKRKSGDIPYIKRGRLVLIPSADLIAYLEQGRVPAADRPPAPGRRGR